MQVNNKGNNAKEMDSQRAKCRPEQKKWAQLYVHNLVTFIRTSGKTSPEANHKISRSHCMSPRIWRRVEGYG